ncbi:MAG: hypothetical protein KC464_10685, partial [Myxococcales bacterium]|nr:hypothetical protein [Myxococcales bacterium]
MGPEHDLSPAHDHELPARPAQLSPGPATQQSSGSAAHAGLDGATQDLLPGPQARGSVSGMAVAGPTATHEGLTNAQIAHAAVLEQMAHGATYAGGHQDGAGVAGAADNVGDAPEDQQARTQMLINNGYDPEPHLTTGANGMQMVVYEPTRPGVAPVVSFRGTEEWDDLIADGDPEQVGNAQYEANHEMIEAEMQRLHETYGEEYGNAELTGHSLGGAIAQITAARNLEQAGSITTFQAPGVAEEEVARIEAFNREHPERAITADHFRVDGCVVSGAGEAHAPGQVHDIQLDRHDEALAAPIATGLLGPALGGAAVLAGAAGLDLPGGLDLGTNPYTAHTSHPLTAMALQTPEGRRALGPEFTTPEAERRWNDRVVNVDTHAETNDEHWINETVRSGVGTGLRNTRNAGDMALDSVDPMQRLVADEEAAGQRTTDAVQAGVQQGVDTGNSLVDGAQAVVH